MVCKLHSPTRSRTNHPEPADDAYKVCLDHNSKWAADTAQNAPDFFPTSSKGQAPQILWLGCSDSRVPETTLLGLKPGEVFTHRNIANILHQTDLSMLSVVEYAVRHIKVKHIVVCGHTSCGGVAAGLGNQALGVLDVWLQPMRILREKHADTLAKLEGADKTTFLAKENVKNGIEVLRRIPTVLEAIKERGLVLHGALYHLEDGKLEDVNVDEPEAEFIKHNEAYYVK
ncbi:carbonic anhydrase [Polychaeton citri CBS 116435]|uniref:Carbonic anhydrase n=1 Tax=Polychaeton citri CBS 116435 TaxID=1314669 RepID=A0A9P4QCL4_9PEZI|nr:carbonic anhydrase [Polychaeton citri CBS 116435]